MKYNKLTLKKKKFKGGTNDQQLRRSTRNKKQTETLLSLLNQQYEEKIIEKSFENNLKKKKAIEKEIKVDSSQLQKKQKPSQEEKSKPIYDWKDIITFKAIRQLKVNIQNELIRSPSNELVFNNPNDYDKKFEPHLLKYCNFKDLLSQFYNPTDYESINKLDMRLTKIKHNFIVNQDNEKEYKLNFASIPNSISKNFEYWKYKIIDGYADYKKVQQFKVFLNVLNQNINKNPGNKEKIQENKLFNRVKDMYYDLKININFLDDSDKDIIINKLGISEMMTDQDVDMILNDNTCTNFDDDVATEEVIKKEQDYLDELDEEKKIAEGLESLTKNFEQNLKINDKEDEEYKSDRDRDDTKDDSLEDSRGRYDRGGTQKNKKRKKNKKTNKNKKKKTNKKRNNKKKNNRTVKK
jgi:hypothetical protein